MPKSKGPVIELLEIGADITGKFSKSLSPFKSKCIASCDSFHSPTWAITDSGIQIAVDNRGRHVLHHLLDNPNMEPDTIFQVLERDQSQPLLNLKDHSSFSPLHSALRTLRPSVCEKLITMGCDLLDPDPTGQTALHYIASQDLRMYEPDGSSAIQRQHLPSYYEGAFALWQKYISLGGSINVHDISGSPPLFSYLACTIREDCKVDQCCHVENFDRFFKDADLHAQNEEGETALHIVAKREVGYHRGPKPMHDRMLFEYLVTRGVDPLTEDKKGRSALDIAAACEKKEILELFQYRS